jgi:hypothetical protein
MQTHALLPLAGLFYHAKRLSASFIPAPAIFIKLFYNNVDRRGIIRRFALTKRTDAFLLQSP